MLPVLALGSIKAGLAVGKGVYNAYQNEQARKQARKDQGRKIAGLRKLAEVTPAEREYEKRRRDIIEQGDPLINEAGREAMQRTRQQGQFNRIGSQGQAIQQGLENSIVAQELRRKVDKDVLASIAQQARKMALANAEAKRRAEDQLEQFNMMKDDRSRKIESQIAGMPSIPGYGWRERLRDIAKINLDASEAFLNSGGFNSLANQGGGGDYNISQSEIDAMSNSQYESYLDDFFS